MKTVYLLTFVQKWFLEEYRVTETVIGIYDLPKERVESIGRLYCYEYCLKRKALFDEIENDTYECHYVVTEFTLNQPNERVLVNYTEAY